jgi:protein O-mannosyl-transferase
VKSKPKQQPKQTTVRRDLPASGRAVDGAGRGWLPRARERGWLPGLLLMAATVLAYGPALRGGFLWDDDSWTTGIGELLKNLHGLGLIWLQPTALQQYYPLTATTFWVDYHLWGFWTTPYHVENVLLHGLAAVLFWRLLRRLKVPGAWLAGAVFALHPLMVESAAWITERKNVLSLVLYLGALLAYGRYAGFWEGENQLRRRGAYALAWVLLLGALLAKTTAFSLPAVLLLLCWWKRGRLRWRMDVVPTLPFFALAVGLSLVTAWLEKHHVGAQGSDWDLSFAQRCLVAGRVLWFYAGKVVWPSGLCFVYPRWVPDAHAWWQWLYPIGALGLVAGLWLGRKRLGRGPLTAVLFFAGTLFPVLGFMNAYYMRYSFVCDHWAYLSSLGLIALGAAQAAARVHWQRALPAAAVVLLLVLGTLTWCQSRMYRDMETLWRTTLAINPRSNLGLCCLGVCLMERGESGEAELCFRKAMEYWPDFPEAHSGLATILSAQGRLDEALEEFQKTVDLHPRGAHDQNNLGAALLKKDRVDEAMSHLRTAVTIRPQFVEAQSNLGVALLLKGRYDDAIAHFRKALEIQPDYAGAQANLDRAMRMKEQAAQTIAHLQDDLRKNPRDPDTHEKLGRTLLQNGQMDEAIAQFQLALEIRPDSVEIRNDLARALLQKGSVDGAVAQLQKALEFQTNSPMTLGNLASVAWMLATSPEPVWRDGAKALELARQTDLAAAGTNTMATATLAAAYAEMGRFADAITTAQRALQVANGGTNAVLQAMLQEQLDAYRANRPYRDNSVTLPDTFK